jgi:hypothetical protein
MGRGLTGSHLFIARVWGHVALADGVPGCLALPANPRTPGPGVLHISRCPNVNPQGWAGLWPEA